MQVEDARDPLLGSQLAQYAVTAKLGEGGMGRVYRATDGKLGREVALKVLAENVAEDPARLARFEREARLLASLNHPNIAQVYGFEREDVSGSDVHFLVMELAQGETLADLVSRGPLPVQETRGIGLQLALALEDAHRAGVVHRDLKPANIQVSRDGSAWKVKVLDFGLAKALATPADSAALSDSPTLTQPTTAGSLLGTAAYMAPEQARGEEADERSDVWALGCVLYELLTGERAFVGDTASEVLASVLRDEPDLAKLPPATDSGLRHLVKRCLSKDPRSRFQHVGDVRYELEAAPEAAAFAPTGAEVTEHGRLPTWALGSLLVVGLGLSVLFAVGVFDSRSESNGGAVSVSSSSNTQSRSEVWTTANLTIPGDVRTIAFSPDGRRVVYGLESRTEPLRIRDLQTGQITELPGTQRGDIGLFVSFSPDGDEVYFVDARNRLSSIMPSSGLVTVHQDDVLWGFEDSDGHLYYVIQDLSFGGEGFSSVRLRRRRLPDGEEERLGRGFTMQGSALPGGRFRLGWPGSHLAVIDTETREMSQLEARGGLPLYLREDFVCFFSFDSKQLVASRFDRLERTLLGEAKVIETQIATTFFSNPIFALSPTGDLLYRRDPFSKVRALWVGRKGQDLGAAGPGEGQFIEPRVSPDGGYASFGSPEALSLLDLDRGSWRHRQLAETYVSGRGNEHPGAIWLGQHGEEIAFVRSGDGRSSLFVGPAEGGAARLLPVEKAAGDAINLLDATPDGRFLFISVWPHYVLSVFDRETELTTPLVPGKRVISAAVHPDGRFLAFSPFGEHQGVWLLSLRSLGAGGSNTAAEVPERLLAGDYSEVLWSPGGDELYFRSPTHVMSIGVEIEDNRRLTATRPESLFEDRYQHSPTPGFRNWAVHPDGRFLMLRAVDQDASGDFVYIQNWVAKVAAQFSDAPGG